MEETKPPVATECDHKLPPGYAKKRKRMRFVKEKKYVWLPCPKCNVTFIIAEYGEKRG